MGTEKLWPPEQVAEMLGVSKQTLAVWRCEQRYPLPYLKVGSRVRYRPADVERFVERQAKAGADAPSRVRK
jgi:excisionase family DNA binding protein